MYGRLYLVTCSQKSVAIANARETETPSLRSLSTWRIVSIYSLTKRLSS